MAVSLGQTVEEFRPANANVAAGYILALVAIAGGLAILGYDVKEIRLSGGQMPIAAEHGMSWVSAGLFAALALGLFAVGYFLARYARSLSARSVDFCNDGFRYRQGEVCDEVRWEEIDRIREIIIYERPPVVKGAASMLIPKKASHSYHVFCKSGKEYNFNGDSVKEIGRLGALLRERAEGRGLAWEVLEDHS
jgi:hypothetical protein